MGYLTEFAVVLIQDTLVGVMLVSIFFLFCFLMIVITWNCQGAMSPNFLRAFVEYKKLYKTNIFLFG